MARQPTSMPTETVRRRDAKRAAILEGAKIAFLTEGFERTSMDVVASHAGVSKMTVYRHFRSKETLFGGVIVALCGQIVERDLESLLESHQPRAALTRFSRKMAEIIFDTETVELHRIVIAECRHFPKVGRLFYVRGPEVCIRALQRYFQRHKKVPGFKIQDPRRSAEEFLELLRGYAHLRLMLGLERPPTRLQIDHRIEDAINHVFNESAVR